MRKFVTIEGIVKIAEKTGCKALSLYTDFQKGLPNNYKCNKCAAKEDPRAGAYISNLSWP
jgi:hypothetical protein